MDLTHVLVLAALLASAAEPARARTQSPPGAQRRLLSPQELEPQLQSLFGARRFAEAEGLLTQYVQQAPNEHRVWNWLGVAQFAQKRYAAAATSFTRCAELSPPDLDVLTNLGAAQFLSEQFEPAQRSLKRALERDATNARAHLFLARIALHENDAERAEAAFRAAASSTAPDAVALFHFGMFLLQERRLEEAKAQLERSLALDPNYASAHNTLGLVLQRMGDKAGAQRHLARFKELTEVSVGADRQRMRITALLRATYRELEDGNLEAALSAALEAADLAPQFAVTHQTVADVYRRMGRAAEADAAAQRAAALTAAPTGGDK